MDEFNGKQTTLWRSLRTISRAKPIQMAVVLLSMGSMFYVLATSFSRLGEYHLRFDFASLLAGILLAWISFWLAAAAWACVVRALQPEMPLNLAVRYHLISVATKYLPTPGWQQMGKAFQLYQYGLNSRQVWTLVVLEFAITVLSGITVGLSCLVYSQYTFLNFDVGPAAKLLAVAAFWAVCLAVPAIVSRLRRGRAITANNLKTTASWLWGAEVLDMVGWLAIGASLWLVGTSLVPLSMGALSYCIAALVFSFLAGFVVLIAPNGWGIRELAMAALLLPLLPVPANIVAALLSRVALLLAESLSVLLFVVIQRCARIMDRGPNSVQHRV